MMGSGCAERGGSPSDGGGSARLIELAYEMLDAGLDTLELIEPWTQPNDVSVGSEGFGWALHADYLRALQRRGREILAAETAGLRPDRLLMVDRMPREQAQ